MSVTMLFTYRNCRFTRLVFRSLIRLYGTQRKLSFVICWDLSDINSLSFPLINRHFLLASSRMKFPLWNSLCYLSRTTWTVISIRIIFSKYWFMHRIISWNYPTRFALLLLTNFVQQVMYKYKQVSTFSCVHNFVPHGCVIFQNFPSIICIS